LSGLPSLYSDKVQYDNLGTLDETIRREKHIYEKKKREVNIPKILE
jgi:hypothetical protein